MRRGNIRYSSRGQGLTEIHCPLVFLIYLFSLMPCFSQYVQRVGNLDKYFPRKHWPVWGSLCVSLLLWRLRKNSFSGFQPKIILATIICRGQEANRKRQYAFFGCVAQRRAVCRPAPHPTICMSAFRSFVALLRIDPWLFAAFFVLSGTYNVLWSPTPFVAEFRRTV